MTDDDKKLERSIELMRALTEGINPFTGEVQEDGLLNDPRMLRCLYYVIEILEKAREGSGLRYINRKTLPYYFPEGLMAKVALPSESIGVNAFAKAVNMVLDAARSKNLTGNALNLQLKKMGILTDIAEENGKHRTGVNDSSREYGIEVVTGNFEGKVFEKVVFNEKGKRFLLENLQRIMEYAG